MIDDLSPLTTKITDASSLHELFGLLSSNTPSSSSTSCADGLILLEIEKRICPVSDCDLAASVSSFWFNSILESAYRNVSNDLNTEVICSILKKLLGCIPCENLLKQFQVEILQLFSKTSVNVVQVAVEKICNCIEKCPSETLSALQNDSVAIVVAAVRRVVSEAEGRQNPCKDLLTKIAEYKKGATDVLLGNNIVSEELRCIVQQENDDIVRFRIYQLVILCCSLHAECVDLCIDKSLLAPLVAQVDGSDVLCKLNALELLAELVSESDYAAQVLQREAAIRFFGYLARAYPELCCQNYPEFLTSVFDMVSKFEYLEPAQRLLSFDTLSLIGSTKEGKNVLLSHKEAMSLCMKCFGKAVRNGPLDIRIRHLQALHDLLYIQPEDQSDELLNGVQFWFHFLDPSGSLEFIFKLFKQTIPELHIAAGNIIKTIALQSWGQKLIAAEPGLLEYLLNRSTETQMSGRYIKFEILESLIKSPDVSQAFRDQP